VITLLVTGYHLVDDKLILYFSPGEIWAQVVIQLPFLCWIVWRYPRAARVDLRQWFNLLCFTGAMVGTWTLALYGFDELSATEVAAIRNLSVLFGVFWGGHLLAEGHQWWRYFAAGLMCAGVGLVIFYA